MRVRKVSRTLRSLVEHYACRVDDDERGLEECAEVCNALVKSFAVPSASGAVVDRPHPVLHRDGERRASMVLRDWHIDDAIGVEDVLRNLCLGISFSITSCALPSFILMFDTNVNLAFSCNSGIVILPQLHLLTLSGQSFPATKSTRRDLQRGRVGI